jgi:hypothetical protein
MDPASALATHIAINLTTIDGVRNFESESNSFVPKVSPSGGLSWLVFLSLSLSRKPVTEWKPALNSDAQ